ncbi:MAG: tRNA-dihydrouridine synthase [Bacteroidales bacterium]|nr:tRNA-dihydrouridine synthase [Bacteroidales bacterium]
MISNVKQNISVTLMVGGDIRTPEKAKENLEAGANVIVIGNAIENKHSLITSIAEVVHSFK